MADGAASSGKTLSSTTSLCRTCKKSVPAEIVRLDDQVYLRKRCTEHGPEEVLISSSADWYEETLGHSSILMPPAAPKPVRVGCPYDCGSCAAHEQRNHLPVVPITSKCDLDCPICYTHNKNDGAYHMSEAELASILKHLQHAVPDRRIINLTGGEPTQHPAFERIVEMCAEFGLNRVTISTHGLRILRDE